MNYILYNPKSNSENNDLNIIPGKAELEKFRRASVGKSEEFFPHRLLLRGFEDFQCIESADTGQLILGKEIQRSEEFHTLADG